MQHPKATPIIAQLKQPNPANPAIDQTKHPDPPRSDILKKQQDIIGIHDQIFIQQITGIKQIHPNIKHNNNHVNGQVNKIQ